MKARQRYSFKRYYLIIYYSWSVMVRFTAIQTDGFKSNDLPSTKIVIWPNKITFFCCCFPCDSVYFFLCTPPNANLKISRFGYCPTLFPCRVWGKPPDCSVFRGGRQSRAAQVTSYHGAATGPLQGATHSGFSLQVSTDSAYPSSLKNTL